MTYIAGNSYGDEVARFHAAVGWVEGDPARTRNMDLDPGMSESEVRRAGAVVNRIKKIAGNETRPKT